VEGGGFEGRRRVLIHLTRFALEKGNFELLLERPEGMAWQEGRERVRGMQTGHRL